MVRHLGAVVLSWLCVTAVCFCAIHALPGDPVEIFLQHLNVAATPETVAALRASWGLDRPLPVQFANWISSFLLGDWGVSFQTGADIAHDLGRRLPWSAAIGIGGLAIATVIGTVLGFRAALHPGRACDTATRFFAVAGQALPAFAVGLVVLWLLAAELRLIRPFSGSAMTRLVLPIALVAFFSIGGISRLVRSGFVVVSRAAYFRTALAKGLSPATALWRHGRRHTGLVLLAGLAPELAWVVGGTAVAEIVFGVPGVSERVVQAVAARDYAVLQAYVALIAAWMLFVLKVAIWMGHHFDPRAV